MAERTAGPMNWGIATSWASNLTMAMPPQSMG
jgi:hypothetical protein